MKWVKMVRKKRVTRQISFLFHFFGAIKDCTVSPPLQNSYVEALNLTVMVSGSGAFGS